MPHKYLVRIVEQTARAVISEGGASGYIVEQTARASISSDVVRGSIVETTVRATIPGGAPGPQGEPGSGSATIEIIAGEDLAPRDLIYIDTDGKAYKADANSSDKDAEFYVQEAVLTDETGTAYLPGVIEGFTGLTPNTRYFLSDTVPGGMMDTTPAQDGTEKIVQQVARSISETAVLFDPHDPIYISRRLETLG